MNTYSIALPTNLLTLLMPFPSFLHFHFLQYIHFLPLAIPIFGYHVSVQLLHLHPLLLPFSTSLSTFFLAFSCSYFLIPLPFSAPTVSPIYSSPVLPVQCFPGQSSSWWPPQSCLSLAPSEFSCGQSGRDRTGSGWGHACSSWSGGQTCPPWGQR